MKLLVVVPTSYYLITEKGRVRGFMIDSQSKDLKSAIRPITSVTRPLLMDYDRITGLVYYSDVILKTVMELNPQTGKTRVVLGNLEYPEGIAVDASAGVVYYGDRQLNVIGAVRIKGGVNAKVITEKLDEPRAIVLDIADR